MLEYYTPITFCNLETSQTLYEKMSDIINVDLLSCEFRGGKKPEKTGQVKTWIKWAQECWQFYSAAVLFCCRVQAVPKRERLLHNLYRDSPNRPTWVLEMAAVALYTYTAHNSTEIVIFFSFLKTKMDGRKEKKCLLRGEKMMTSSNRPTDFFFFFFAWQQRKNKPVGTPSRKRSSTIFVRFLSSTDFYHLNSRQYKQWQTESVLYLYTLEMWNNGARKKKTQS